MSVKKTVIKKGEQWRKGYQTGSKEMLIACGGCKNCYGKGYATVLDFNSSTSDFGAIKKTKTKNPIMRFCPCGRGKQLSLLLYPLLKKLLGK